jgi:hypothetical protein
MEMNSGRFGRIVQQGDTNPTGEETISNKRDANVAPGNRTSTSMANSGAKDGPPARKAGRMSNQERPPSPFWHRRIQEASRRHGKLSQS